MQQRTSLVNKMLAAFQTPHHFLLHYEKKNPLTKERREQHDLLKQ